MALLLQAIGPCTLKATSDEAIIERLQHIVADVASATMAQEDEEQSPANVSTPVVEATGALADDAADPREKVSFHGFYYFLDSAGFAYAKNSLILFPGLPECCGQCISNPFLVWCSSWMPDRPIGCFGVRPYRMCHVMSPTAMHPARSHPNPEPSHDKIDPCMLRR